MVVDSFIKTFTKIFLLTDPRKHRVAGVFIVRDMLITPKGFDATYSSKEKTLTPWMQLILSMEREVIQVMPELIEEGKTAELCFLGIHPDYRGNRISNSLVKGALPLCKRNGFKFATIEATSYFTSKAAQFHGFKEVFSINVEDRLWIDQALKSTAEEPHGKWKFWVKNLETL